MNKIHYIKGYGKKQYIVCDKNLDIRYNSTNEVSFVSCDKCKLILKYEKLL